MKKSHEKILYTISLVVLVMAAMGGLILAGKFLGYMTQQSEGGTLTELILEFTSDQDVYGGVAGVAVRVPGFSSEQSSNIFADQIEKENLLFDCLNPSGEQEIYASLVPVAQLDLTTFSAATHAEVDAFSAANTSGLLSAANTYRTTATILYRSQSISAPAARSYTINLGAANFTTVLLKDTNDNLIFGSILTNFTQCFDTTTCNFQMVLPVFNGTNQTYYFFTDPDDDCPAGTTGGDVFATVYGNVTDTSGNPIEDAIVDVAGFTTLSDSNGFYNLTTISGTFNIFGIKEGFQTFQDNITTSFSNATAFNIVMVPIISPNPNTDVGPGPGEDEPGTATQTGIGPGTDVGPGQTNVPLVIEEPKKIEGQDYVISISEIKRKIRIDSFLQETVKFFNFKDTTAEITLELNGTVVELIEMDKEKILIDTDQADQVTLTIFGRGSTGIYNGSLVIDGDMNATIPIEIEVLPKEKVPVEALVIDIDTSEKSYTPNSDLKFKTDLRNMITDRAYPVTLFFTIQNEKGDETLWTYNTNVFLRTSFTLIKSVKLPKDVDPGDYVLRVTATYLGLNSGTSTIFKIIRAWYNRLIFGKVPVWALLLALFVIGSSVGAFFYIRKKIEEKKRYHLKVDYDTLPKPGPRSVFVGKIAETDNKTYFNMEKFKTHTIVAGSTGGGKSVSGQVIIEEMLKKDVAVVVFDPTAQWSGMLRRCKDKGMIALYGFFGMKPTEAQAFNGNIREISDAREVINPMDYAKNGEIQVFACHRLDPKDMDIVVASSIREMFRSNLQESKPLRLMIVFDEVHRLLPKFGGSGQGFLQIERCCREFRKWGIGVMLISQVLSDFVGTIKANINTEIQMRTRDEGDLERIRQKYGENVLRSLTMATVGSGMVENPAYNNGKPFFVAFRPLLHSTERLTDEEISEYTKYNDEIDELVYSLDQLEEKEIDVFDLKLELKLALDKVKTGNFNVVNVYLEGLRPRIDKEWSKIGEKPRKLEKKLVSLSDLEAEFETAQQERKDFEEANKKEETTEKKDEGPPAWDTDADPSKLLNLVNGMIVINQQSLYDEISAMKDEDYEKHVNDSKNDFADWIENAIGDQELAIHMRGADSKEKILELLDMRKNEQDLPELSAEEKAKMKPVQKASDEKKAFEELSQEPEKNAPQEKEEAPAEAVAVEKAEETPTTETAPAAEQPAATEEPKEETKQESPPASAPEEVKPEQPSVAQPETPAAAPEEPVAQAETETAPTETAPAAEEAQPTPTETQSTEQQTPTEEQPAEQPATAEVQAQPATEQPVAPASTLEELVAKDPGDFFKLSNGKEIKSVGELKNYLKEMPEEMFKEHVGEDYNHFADWIESVFHAGEVASHIRGITDRTQMSEALQ